MKKTKNYLLLLICGIVAAASFSSCFNDNDNDYSIDAATQKKYQTTISTLSPYANNARFYYASNFTVNKYDSIKGNSVYCRFTADSTFQVTGIPVCKLDSAVKVGVNETKGTYRELFDAIHNSTEMAVIKGYYCIPQSNWAQQNFLQYIVSLSIQAKLNYGGEDHNVLFAFNSSQSYGIYKSTDLSNGMSLVLAAIYMDYESVKKPGTQLPVDYLRNIQITLTKN